MNKNFLFLILLFSLNINAASSGNPHPAIGDSQKVVNFKVDQLAIISPDGFTLIRNVDGKESILCYKCDFAPELSQKKKKEDIREYVINNKLVTNDTVMPMFFIAESVHKVREDLTTKLKHKDDEFHE